MTDTNDYKNLINDIIEKQKVILGPDLVMLKAKNVKGLTLNGQGQVESLDGEPQEILQKLIDEYIALSGQIVKNILSPVFAKYPQIKVSIN